MLATIHRAENTDSLENLKNIFEGLETISLECPVVIPLHPRTKKKLMEINYDFANTPIRIIDPVGYLEMVYLLQRCEMVVCDSGGLQKEAYFFKKYSLFVLLPILLGLNWQNMDSSKKYFPENRKFLKDLNVSSEKIKRVLKYNCMAMGTPENRFLMRSEKIN